MPYILIYDFLFISNKRDIIKEDLNCNFPDWGCSEQMCTSILFWVTEVRCKILTPLETTGGNSFLLEGFKKCFLQFKTLRRVNHSSGGLQMSFQGVYKSTGGIQISIQGVYKSTGKRCESSSNNKCALKCYRFKPGEKGEKILYLYLNLPKSCICFKLNIHCSC